MASAYHLSFIPRLQVAILLDNLLLNKNVSLIISFDLSMKNKILLGAILFIFSTFSMSVNAQLEVKTSGDVVISKCAAVNGAEVDNKKAIKIKAPFHGSGASAFGIYSYIKQSHPLIVTSGTGIGVYGCTMPYTGGYSLNLREQPRLSSSAFYAGVAGQSNSHVGIYGTTLNTLPTIWTEGNYAGYFEGDVKVTGLLNGVNFTTNADRRNFENISQLGVRSTTNMLLQLNPISYTLSTDSIPVGSNETKRVHYGFVAQELQTIAPELVYEDGAGNYSIDYIALIPLLVQKVQELSAKVENQDKQIKELQ